MNQRNSACHENAFVCPMQGSIDRLEDRLEEFMAKIDKALFEGNGVPPMMVRMSNTERQLDFLLRERTGIMGGLGKFIIYVAGVAFVALVSFALVLWADHRPNTNTKGKTDAKVSAVHDGSDSAGR